MWKRVPQHPINPALVDGSGDTREAKRKDSHSVKESAWTTTTEGEGGKRNALFGPVSLIPVGCHQSKGDAWGEKKLNYQLLPLPGIENHIILLRHLEDPSLKTLGLPSTAHTHFHFRVARWKPPTPLFAHSPFVSISLTPQRRERSYRMYRHHLHSFSCSLYSLTLFGYASQIHLIFFHIKSYPAPLASLSCTCFSLNSFFIYMGDQSCMQERNH